LAAAETAAKSARGGASAAKSARGTRREEHLDEEPSDFVFIFFIIIMFEK